MAKPIRQKEVQSRPKQAQSPKEPLGYQEIEVLFLFVLSVFFVVQLLFPSLSLGRHRRFEVSAGETVPELGDQGFEVFLVAVKPDLERNLIGG